MINRELKFAGDVQIDKLMLTSLNGQTVNIINQIQTIEIYEDMLSPFISLSIVVRESQDFLNLLPFIGEEYLDINIYTPEIKQKIKGRFYIYKISDRIQTKDREVMYTIKATSEEFLNDINTKLSSPLEDKISDSALKVIAVDGLRTKKPINIEPTLNRTKLVPNYWSPIKSLSELSERAISVNGSPSYLFFENRQGFNFVSVNKLLQQDSYQSFIKDNYSRQESSSINMSSVKDPTEDFKRIIDIDIPLVTSYIDDIKEGQIKSELISYDIVTKKYVVNDYNIKTENTPFTLLNKNLVYSKYALANPKSLMINRAKHYNAFDDYADTTDSAMVQRRLSFFKNLEQHKVEIEILGRSDYTVGQVVDLELPKITQITKDDRDPRDKMLSGRYLVTAITHYINRSQHTCKMELVKNSVLFDLEKV